MTDSASMPTMNDSETTESPMPPAGPPISSLVAKIQGGKLDWPLQDLLPYYMPMTGAAESTAKARAALISRTIAETLGISVTSTGRGYRFTPVKAALPVIASRGQTEAPPASNQAGDEDLEAPVKFPELPLPGKVNPSYVQPAWYKRMAAALDAGKHVSLAGPPGGGKSTGPEQYFLRKGQPFVVVNGDAGFRRRDMEGSVEVRNGSTFFRVAEFAAAAVNGWGCILNEVNAADPDALLYINGLLEVPFVVNIHGKAYPVHKDFRLVVTYNPGLIGTKALPQAFKDRFLPIKLDFPPRDFIRKMIYSKTGVNNPIYMERLLKYAEDAWTLHVKGSLRYQISPRRLFDVVFLMESNAVDGLDMAIKNAIVDAVDSASDAQMLMKLVTSPLNVVMAMPKL